MAKKGGLGKGLDALFLDNTTENESSIKTLRITQIEPNKQQPRREFNQESLNELADSIAEHGIIQPIVVRPMSNGTYQIVAGERRWRASRIAGLTEVPVVIKEIDDLATMELALIENLQREDLNPVEEAEGYRVLMNHYGMTQEQVAKRVGKSRPVVANAVRLLSLPDTAILYIKEGKLSTGHAKILAGLDDKQTAEDLALKIVDKGLTVRQAEQMVRQIKEEGTQNSSKMKKEQIWGNNYFKEVEIALTEELGRKVKVSPSASGGKLEVEFFSKEDLMQLAKLISGSKSN